MGDVKHNLMRRICVGDILKRTARRFPKKEAMAYSYKRNIVARFTFEDVDRKANRLANALIKLGIRKGDRVAIMSNNCPQYVFYFMALSRMGAWATPVNFNNRGREISQLINHSESIMFIVEDELVDRVKEVQQDMPSVKQYVMININKEKSLPQGWLDFDELCSEKYPDTEPYVEIKGDDVFTLLYTSGTEAMPKGCMNAHLNGFSMLEGQAIDSGWFPAVPEDCELIIVPLYHAGGICRLFTAIMKSEKIVLPYGTDPMEILQLLQGEKVTESFCPATLYTKLLKAPVPNVEEFLKKVFSSGRTFIISAAPITHADMRRLLEVLPDIHWVVLYGQTESTGSYLGSPDLPRKFKEAEERFGGAEPIGLPSANNEIKIVDENDNEVPRGTIGEMVVRSPSVMLGYYKEEELTKEVFRGGWLHTGDLALMDEENYLYFVDRKKDIVITGGENVSSLQVENEICEHPKVAEVAIVALPHPKWVEAVTAFVVPKPNESVTEEEVIRFCKERIAGYKVPKKVVVLDKIPRNPTGKALKKDIRKQFQDLYQSEK